MAISLTRRTVLLGAGTTTMLAACTTMLAACTTPRSADTRVPIVFMHGNGDTAALWIATLWRFESNGWPRERLHAVDVPTRRHATTTPMIANDDAAVPLRTHDRDEPIRCDGDATRHQPQLSHRRMRQGGSVHVVGSWVEWS